MMANQLSPIKVGLALGAGASRGLAHIGVIKVLRKYNVPIHLISGTSMGAVIGAFAAAGLETEEMEKAAYDASWLKFYHPVLLKSGLSRGKKVKTFLEHYIGHLTFGRLPIPLVVSATDLDTGKEVALFSGNVANAVLASASLPGFFIPVQRGSLRLIDGGLVNPLPVSHLIQRGCGYIIAVDVQSHSIGTDIYDPLEAVLRAFDLMQQPLVRASQKKAHLVIQPEIGGIYPLGFSDAETRRFIKAGEEAAEEVIDQILQHLKLNPGP